MTRRLILALGRHAETEAESRGASPGTRFLFASLATALRRHVTLLPIPPTFYRAEPRQALRIAVDILRQADACLFGLPPNPWDLDPFFLVRERMRPSLPVLYMPLGEFPRGAWFYRHMHSWLGARDLLLFSSHADKAIHESLVSVSPAQSMVIPLGIRTRQFRPLGRLRHATRRQLGLDEDDIVLVYHGRITAEKNVHAVLGIARRLARDHPQLRLWIIGAPAEDARLAGAIKELLRDPVLAPRTRLWGQIAPEALPRLLGAADISITLTLNGDENFGYGAVEAMACGLPVVGTDWGGLKDTIEHGVTGFRTPTAITAAGAAFDGEAALNAVSILLKDRSLRLRMGAAGRESALRRFDLRDFAQGIAFQVDTLVGRPQPTAAPHEWTALGRSLVNAFTTSGGAGLARPVAQPVPPGRTLLYDYPLMREVLGPYATKRGPEQNATILSLATEFLRSDRYGLRSTDPRYPFALHDITVAERAVVAYLRHCGHAKTAMVELEAARFLNRTPVRVAIQRLLRFGVIVEFSAVS